MYRSSMIEETFRAMAETVCPGFGSGILVLNPWPGRSILTG